MFIGRIGLSAALALLVACESENLVSGGPSVSATPATLDFGTLAVGERRARALSLANAGDVAVVVIGVAVEADARGAFSLTAVPPSFIPPGGTAELQVTYRGGSPGLDEGEVAVRFDDAPPVRVPLRGRTVRGDSGVGDAGVHPDARGLEDADLPDAPDDVGFADATATDAAASDAGSPDLGLVDAGSPDLGLADAETPDLGLADAGPSDAAPGDLGVADAGPADGAILDATQVDMPPASCQIRDLIDGFLPSAMAATATVGPRQHGMIWRRTVAGRQQTFFGLLDVAGDFVTPPGPIDITDADTQNVQDLALVWTGTEFGAVWWLPGVGAVFQRIDRAGRRIGGNVVVSGGGQPAVAYNRRDQEFLVAWRGSTQRLDVNGNLIGGRVTNSSRGRTSVAWSPTTGQYVHVSVGGSVLEHRVLTAAGQQVSVRPLYTPPTGFDIDSNAGNTLLPMVYNHADHELAVAFRLKPSSRGGLYDASIQLLIFDPAGTQLALREAAPQAPRGLLEPGLVWSDGGYGVAWTGHLSPYPVTVLHTDRRGAPRSTVLDVACQRGNRMIYPALAFNGTSYITMWNMPWRVFSTVWTP